MAITLTEDFAEVTLGPITLSNNTSRVDPWGFGHWVNGRVYFQALRYIPGDILAYPELTLGCKPWSAAGDAVLVGRVSQLRALMLTTDVDIRGQTDGFNIASDLWLTDRP